MTVDDNVCPLGREDGVYLDAIDASVEIVSIRRDKPSVSNAHEKQIAGQET